MFENDKLDHSYLPGKTCFPRCIIPPDVYSYLTTYIYTYIHMQYIQIYKYAMQLMFYAKFDYNEIASSEIKLMCCH